MKTEETVIADITIGEQPIDELLRSDDAFWWRQRPAPIQPGKSGVVEVCANANAFSPGPVSVQITLRDKDGAEAQTEVDLREVKLIPGYIYREDDMLRLFVRNDETWMTYTILSQRLLA